MNGQIILKIVLTVFFTGICFSAVRWVWTHQLDPVATIKQLVHKTFKGPDWIITREPNKLYQGGQVVGEVTGTVAQKPDTIHFSQLANTNGLKQTQEFQYQKLVLKIHRIGSSIGMASESVMSDDGVRTRVLNAVLEDVDCVIIR